MTRSALPKALAHLPNFTARKVRAVPGGSVEDVPDSLAAWATRYLALAVVGVRSEQVTQKIALHLDRFITSFIESYGHDRISACLRRDIHAWQKVLVAAGQNLKRLLSKQGWGRRPRPSGAAGVALPAPRPVAASPR